jgi:hypothetical protein
MIAAAVRYAGRRSVEAAHVLRGKRILFRYSRHYQRAQHAYRAAGGELAAARCAIRDVGVRVIRPGETGLIDLPPAHLDVVARVSASAQAALASSANCQFVPSVKTTALPAASDAVAEVTRGEVLTIKLLDPFAIDGLRDLCEPLLSELERKVYGSFTIADKVYVYRSPISRQAPIQSWLWHFDNHPREMLKVMVYLTDVDDGTAPFEYLRARASGAAVAGGPLTPKFGNSRVPQPLIDAHLANGSERCRVTGRRGTVIVFDDNVIHRGTLAQTGARDVLVIQVRPGARIDPAWTGSFTHQAFHSDPRELAQRPNSGEWR